MVLKIGFIIFKQNINSYFPFDLGVEYDLDSLFTIHSYDSFCIASFFVRLWSHSEQEAQQHLEHLDHMQFGYCNKNIRIYSNMTTIIKCRHVSSSHRIIYHMRERPTEAEFQTIYVYDCSELH